MRFAILCAALAACGATPAPAKLPARPTSPVEATPAVTPPSAPKPSEPDHPWPATRTDDLVETLHGKTIRDPYRWLEDEHSPEVQAWMKAQDAYARAELAKLPERGEL